jgi:hypothetical protein
MIIAGTGTVLLLSTHKDYKNTKNLPHPNSPKCFSQAISLQASVVRSTDSLHRTIVSGNGQQTRVNNKATVHAAFGK